MILIPSLLRPPDDQEYPLLPEVPGFLALPETHSHQSAPVVQGGPSVLLDLSPPHLLEILGLLVHPVLLVDLKVLSLPKLRNIHVPAYGKSANNGQTIITCAYGITEREITVRRQIFCDHFMFLSDQRIIWSAIMSEQ